MTITQTVDIPDNHRLTIDVPKEVPSGKAILTFTPTYDQESAMKHIKEREFSCAEGKFKMADDFYAPISGNTPQYCRRSPANGGRTCI